MKSILLAEDNANDVELTLAALQGCHLTNSVEVVHDGEQALDFLYCRGAYANQIRELPGVILLDLKMPKIDGLQVLKQIKSDPVLRRIPVVMLTSSREEKDLVRSYDLG